MTSPTIATTPEIDALLAANAAVVCGVSGGIDSQASALATFHHLDAIKHTGPRALIHSDLGVTEWEDSLHVCRDLAAHLGTELIVVRRKAGDMMDRWESRWASSVERYASLSTVTLVPPWSTPALRFCTSELKTHVISAELKRRFKGHKVINVTGVRRDESRNRAKQPIATLTENGADWRIIADWSKAEAFAYVKGCGLCAHRAYTDFNMSRVSCRFCIMSSQADLERAASDPASHNLYRRQARLEIASTFSFQANRWLADVAPHLLDDEMRAAIAEAKRKAAIREAAEARIHKDMLYVKGWPTRMLTDDEADLLADVRRTVSKLIGIDARCLDRASIHARYAELMAQKVRRQVRQP